MVNSVLASNHQGLRMWAWQRFSAVVMAVYSLFFIAYIAIHPQISFLMWRQLFGLWSMKLATFFFIFFLLVHAWIGMWTIYTDYVKPVLLRGLLHSLTLLALGVFLLWSIMILWSA